MVVPAVIPVTTPVPDIVPTAGVELLHAPPDVALLRVVDCPVHTVNMPVIEEGAGFTVTITLLWQPVGVLLITVEVPKEIPVTIPVETPHVATDGLLLLQVTPGVAELNVDVPPTQILSIPVIGAGSAFTVTTAIATQPVGKV